MLVFWCTTLSAHASLWTATSWPSNSAAARRRAPPDYSPGGALLALKGLSVVLFGLGDPITHYGRVRLGQEDIRVGVERCAFFIGGLTDSVFREDADDTAVEADGDVTRI